MLWLLYNILFAVGYALLLPRFFVRMRRRGGYRKGFLQRFGLYDQDLVARLQGRRRVWVHAVSVGEILVGLRFIREFRAADPAAAFVLTTTTSTGHALAAGRMHPDDVLLYFPCDFPAVVRRALGAIRPRALVLVECELWPNLIRKAAAAGVPVFLISGRISDSSYRGYRMLRAFAAPVLRQMSALLAQTETDRQRLIALGAPAAAVSVMGTVKYDVTDDAPGGLDETRRVLAACGMGPETAILVGGSTWPGEEAALLDAYRALRGDFPAVRLVLVPRHAERRADVEAEIRKRGLRGVSRSELSRSATPPPADPDVLLVDTTGELRAFYACAAVVFVGKSLTAHGGQNPIEPAAAGKAMIVGSHMENFADVIQDLRRAEAVVQVRDAAGLTAELKRLLRDAAGRDALSERAAALVRARRGVIQRSVEIIARRLPP